MPDRAAVILDAKRGRVFAAYFDRSGTDFQPRSEPIEVEPQAFLTDCFDASRSCAVLGSGVRAYGNLAEEIGYRRLDRSLDVASASHVHRLGRQRATLGEWTNAGDLVPYYVRRPDAEEKWNARNPLGKTAS
jgi:tRNA A37 threonylcarbamoyladenosine modification protein TsaB